MMDRLRLPEDQPIEAKMVTKSIERAQRQVESQNFEIRKNVLKYDEVMNTQRENIYKWRSSILEGGAAEDLVEDWITDVVTDAVEVGLEQESSAEGWDWEAFRREIEVYYPSAVGPEGPGKTIDDVVDEVVDEALGTYEARERELGADLLQRVERNVMLSVIDNKWREHLSEMDYLRAGIGLRAMGQRDPLSEYQREAYDMFTDMIEGIKRDTVRYLFHVEVAQPKTQPQRVEAAPPGATGPRAPVHSDKIGRNDPCPCGSGKKYKRCHGAAV
jgi:preprotein translocase subunit SecA